MKKKILIWTVFIVLAFSAGFTLLVYSSSIITRTPLVSPEASADNWDEILANPKPISLQTFSTGTTKPPLSGIVDLENSITKDIEDEIVEVPVKVGLIHHETKGDYLIDAGLDASIDMLDIPIFSCGSNFFQEPYPSLCFWGGYYLPDDLKCI